MTHHDNLKAAVAVVEIVLVSFLAVPAVAHLVSRTKRLKARGYGTITGFYEDLDGEATEKSTHEYSDLPPRTAAWLSASLGLAAATVAAVLSQKTDSVNEAGSDFLRFFKRWLDVIVWVSTVSSSPTHSAG